MLPLNLSPFKKKRMSLHDDTFDSRLEDEFSICELKDGIIHATYKPNLTITLEVAKTVVNNRIAWQKKTLPLFSDSRGVNYADKPAKDYLANEGSEKLSAVALWVDSPMLIASVNFYLKISKPIVPTKLFLKKEKALQWLEKFK